MKRVALGLLVAAGLTTFGGCGEQAKPVPNSNAPAVPPEDSGMSKGAPKPGGEKAVGGRTIGGEKKP